MLFSAFMIFFVSAIFGLIILDAALKGKSSPKAYVNWHGPIALVGIVILSITVYYGDHNPIIIASLIIFILTTLVGLTLLTMDIVKKHLSKWLIIIHSVAGLIALAILLYYLLHHKSDSTSIYAEQLRYTIIQT